MKQYLFPGGCQFGLYNFVLHAASRRHVVNEFPGPLSIKTVISGQVTWTVDGRDLLVDSQAPCCSTGKPAALSRVQTRRRPLWRLIIFAAFALSFRLPQYKLPGFCQVPQR